MNSIWTEQEQPRVAGKIPLIDSAVDLFDLGPR